MENCFGVLSVIFFVQLPKGSKRVTVASIACEHGDRFKKLQEFKELNPNIAKDIVAEFVVREYL